MHGGELQRLHDVVTRANEATTLEGVAKMLVDEGMAVLGVPIAGVWLLDPTRGVLEVVSFGGAPTGPWETVSVHGDSPLASCVRTRAPIWLATPAEYTERFAESRARMTRDIACACLPLVVQDRAIGAAVFASMTTIELTEAEKTKLMLIAGQCAHALERLRLHRDAADLARRMSGLQALAARLATARGLDDVARITTEDAVATLGASAASVWLIEGDAIALVRGKGIPSRVAAEIARIPLDDPGPLASAVRDRRPVWLSSRAAAAGDMEVVPSRWEGIESGAAIPLIAEGELVGGFVVVYAKPRTFEQGERETVEAFAAHCALAIDRLRWIDRERAARRKMEALQAAAIRLAAARGLPETARTICSDVRAAIGGSGVGLWLVEDDVAVLYGHEGWRPELVEAGARIPFDDGRPIAETLRTRQPMWVDRETAASRFDFAPERWKNIESGANLPLVVEDRLVGAFCVTFADARVFTAADRELLEVYARHAAQALDRARLVEATTKLAGRMTALQAIAARFAAARSFEEIAGIVISESVAPAIGATTAGLWLLVGRELVLAKQVGSPPEVIEAVRRVALDDTGLPPQAIRTRKAQYVESRGAAIKRQQFNESRWAVIEAAAFAPLLEGNRIIGGIGLGFGQPRAFDVGEREMIELFAEHAAQAIARERDHSAQRLLADATSSLSASLDAKEVLERVGALTVASFADWCFVDLVRADGSLERAIVAHADPADAELAESLRGVGGPMTSGVASAISSQQPFVIGHISAEDLARIQRTDETGELARALRAQSVVIVPMVVGGRSVGTISWITRTRQVDDRDVAIAAQIARAAAASLENARLYATAEAASRTKDEFLAMLGHELRNPLSPIVTALELLKMRGSAEGARERAIIERQVSHLTRLVDDLLDISRITRGKIELRKKHDELFAAVEPAIEAVSPLIVKYNHTLRVDVPATGLCVDGDRERLSQVVRNLVTNAAKYTPPGGHIEVSARATGAEVELVVADNGRGIAPELLPRVFEPFVQSAQAVDRSGGGLGLGLAIVKSVAELHGGSVTAESSHAGTRMTVRLPRVLEVGTTTPETTDPPRSARGMRVLVVDDNLDAAVLLGDLLRALGHDPVIAHDSAGALAMASKHPPELAILDLGLPDMDGYQLAQELRKALETKPIPVIALTGYGQASDRERSRAAGFAEHLVKPIALQQLHAVVERFAVG